MLRELSIDLTLYPAQDDFVHSQAKYAAFIGGIGSGKTYAGAARALITTLTDGGVGEIVAPTYPMMRDVTLRMFRDLAGDVIADFNRSEMRATLANGAEILFRSADEPERLRGANLTWLWIDEAAQVSESAWLILLGRLRVGRGLAWITTTPKGKQHWTYRVFGQMDATHELYRARTSDNQWLPQSYLDSVRAAYVGSFARQELEGEFVDAEGTLFKREWFGIVDEPPANLRWVRAWDLALTTKQASDRTASVKCATDALGNLYIMDGIAGKWEYPDARDMIIRTAISERGVMLVVERVAFQMAAVQELYRVPELIGTAIIGDEPDRDKVARARAWQARAANGKVLVVAGAWVNDFLDEVCAFTADDSHEHDDYIDAVSMAVKHLGIPSTASLIHPQTIERGNRFRNPYG